MKYFIILLAFCLTACASKPKYDLSALHSFGTALDVNFHESENLNPPYIASFKTQNNELKYIAVRHASDINSQTFKMVKKSIETFAPDLLIVEGIETCEGMSPKHMLKMIQNECAPQWKSCGENEYGLYLADINNTNFIGAEPSYSESVKCLKAYDYTTRDVAFFYFVRQIPQYYREHKIVSRNDIEKLFPKFISNLGMKSNYSFDEYNVWLKEKIGSEVSFKTLIDTEFTAPIGNGNYLQKLSNKIGLMRDQHALNLILNNLKTHKKILVIFGASHYPIQKDVLEKYLGKPSYSQK